jgi:hypothetical protein
MSDAGFVAPPALPPQDRGSILKGFGIAAAVNIGAVILGVITIVAVVGIFLLLGIGLVQAAWIIPLILHFRKMGKPETAKGVIIAAAITFLLNAGCYGLIAVVGLGSMR